MQNREIKFRAKHFDTGQWVYGSFIQESLRYGSIFYIHSMSSDEEEGDTKHRVDYKTVGQLWEPSLNLKVYTGDLLHAECSPSGSNKTKKRIAKIGFTGKGLSVSVWHKGEWYAYSSFNWTTAKVIGNIYEHSHLLTTPTDAAH